MAMNYSDHQGLFLSSSVGELQSRASCQLTPSASAFSTLLSAFVGSVINGLTSGWLVAFATGWIAWMAVFRVLLSGLYMLFRSVTNSWGPGWAQGYGAAAAAEQGDEQGDDDATQLMVYDYQVGVVDANGQPAFHPNGGRVINARPRPSRLQALWPPASVVRALDQPSPAAQPGRKRPISETWADLNRDVTFLGWFSWAYTAIFAPISQLLWVGAHAPIHGAGAVKLVKGMTTAVTALPLCIDCKLRYGDKLGWGRHIFRLITSLSILMQGSICVFLLVQGALDLVKNSTGFPIPFLFIYPVFSLVWMFGSFAIVPTRDGGRKRFAQVHWAGIIVDVGVGAFAGLFLAAPSFALYSSAQFDSEVGGHSGNGMSDLTDYLRCETQVWKKFVAVSP